MSKPTKPNFSFGLWLRGTMLVPVELASGERAVVVRVWYRGGSFTEHDVPAEPLEALRKSEGES